MLCLIYCYAECRYAECRYAECRGAHLNQFSVSTLAAQNKLDHLSPLPRKILNIQYFIQFFRIWCGTHKTHRYRKYLNRLLKVGYVPASSAVLIAFFSSIFAAGINSTNEANKAAGMRR